MQPKFSVVLIARNESKTLPRLVDSLKDFQARGGEIILLDTGSTDGTPDVARGLGCKVTEVGDRFKVTIDKETADKINNWAIVKGESPIMNEGDTLFDYSSARNFAATLSSNDMIATPDCDEIYTKLDLDKVNSLIDSGTQQFEYNFVFAHDPEGRPITEFMHSKFYNRVNLKWVGIIHEVLSGNAKSTYVGEDIIKLEHYQNVETNRSHYLTGLAYDCFMNQDNDRNAHYFARELMYKGRFKSAIEQFERHIAMNKWPTEASQSMIFIGDCHIYLGNEENAISWYTIAYNKEPNRREPFMKLAEMYYRKGQALPAVAYALAATQVPGVNYYANHQPYYTNIPHEILYWGYWQLGKFEESKKHFLKALELQPNNPKYLADKQWYPEDGDLAFTGERLVPGKMAHRPDIEVEHLARYNFAAQFTKDLVVSDMSCGTGYASEILKADRYYGYDISKEAIDFATKHYKPNYPLEKQFYEMDFETMKGDGSVLHPGSTDVVISFETIEHLEDPHNFLNWIKNNTGLFIFSIPINMPSEFHKQVYSVEQIKELIGKYFTDVFFFGQTEDVIGKLDENSKYVVGVAINKTLPKISIVIPTLGRPEGLERVKKSIDELIYPKELIETIIIEDEPRVGVPKRLKEGVEKSTGEWIVYGSNDIEFTPSSILNALKNPGKFIAFNTGELYIDEGNACEHFMIHRDLIPKLGGEIFDTEFNHVGVDNLLWAKLKKLGEAKRSKDAIVHHYHWTKTENKEMDEVYKLAWDPVKVEQDRELLKKKLNEL